MSISRVFTDALIHEQVQNENLQRGYLLTPDGGPNNDYLCKDTSWKTLLDEMHWEHRKQYGDGSGGELDEKNGRPPKMAAFASSSRMIYNLSKEIPNFRFEEQLSTTVGGIANMDGYREKDNTYIFVESKCREPYDHSVKQAIKRNYQDIYKYLREKMPRVFSCVMEDIPDADNGKEPQNKMNVVFFCQGRVVAYFDIKQMICHLLGVVTKFLDSENDLIQNLNVIQFLYLLYNPSKLEMEDSDKAEVMRVFEDTCWMANYYHFEKMFGHVVDYLVELRNKNNKPVPDDTSIKKLKTAFDFKLCDQFDYHSYF